MEASRLALGPSWVVLGLGSGLDLVILTEANRLASNILPLPKNTHVGFRKRGNACRFRRNRRMLLCSPRGPKGDPEASGGNRTVTRARTPPGPSRPDGIPRPPLGLFPSQTKFKGPHRAPRTTPRTTPHLTVEAAHPAGGSTEEKT